jgi:hypothetical protein
MNKKYIELTIIDHSGESNCVKQKIINSINTYLIRNKGAVSDFNLIKDIVDRNMDSEEDEIHSKLSIPLYLGLIGTMIGIVVGLQFLPDISEMISSSKDGANTEGIDALLGGVKIAMIASLVGLGFTIYGNGFLFKDAKQKVEEHKNDFYSFIQARLLPKLSENTSSSIYSLQNNLLKFNEDFKGNMISFESILSEVHTSLDSQVQLVEELKKVDLSTMAKANVTVLKELKFSIGQLQNFGAFLDQLNVFVANTNSLNRTISNQMDMVGDFSSIINNLNENAEKQRMLSSYLASYFQQFDSREQSFSNSMTKFDSYIADILDKLKVSLIQRAQEFNNVDVQLSEGFSTLFDDIKNSINLMFEQQNQNIKTLSTQIKSINSTSNEVSKISSDMNRINDKIDKINNVSNTSISGFNLPISMKWLLYIFLILGIVVFAIFVFSMIINLFK